MDISCEACGLKETVEYRLTKWQTREEPEEGEYLCESCFEAIHGK